jgi:uncharacterized cupin superfamily protein
MEVHPAMFMSDVDAREWEPLADVPGSEFHALVGWDDYSAGLWRVPGEGTMTFRWSVPARDTFLVLEGTARIEIDDGPTLEVRPGSIVSFPPGTAATWHVTKPYKDLYVITGAS